jgi:hypothetical protein
LTLPNGVAFEDGSIHRKAWTDYQNPQLVADADRCTGHINALRGKANTERQAQSAITVVGGTMGIVGGSSAALLSNDDAQKTAAVTALVGGIVTLIGQVVGSPSEDAQAQKDALKSWTEADQEFLKLKTAKDATVPADRIAAEVRIKSLLDQCGNR